VSVVTAVLGDHIRLILSIPVPSVEVLPSLLAVEPLPTLMESAFVLSLVTLVFAGWSRKLTAQQFFWLVTVVISVVFVLTMLFSVKYM
jgi:hypothetical protein